MKLTIKNEFVFYLGIVLMAISINRTLGFLVGAYFFFKSSYPNN